MKRLIQRIVMPCLLLLLSAAACAAPLKVVASTLDMADLVKQIGKEKVEVYAVSTGSFDLHFFTPKPRQIIKLKSCDMLVTGGLGVDPWITALIDASRNPNINYGADGFVDPSEGIKALYVPKGRLDGSMGDVHPHGNPHFWVIPDNIIKAVDNITKALIRLRPKEEAFFLKNQRAYNEKVKETFSGLKKSMEPFAGTNVMQFHSSWDYLCRYFGLNLVGSVEPKPGLPPTPSHLQSLIKHIKKEDVRLILAEPYYSQRPLDFLKNNTDVKVLRLPFYLNKGKSADTVLGNIKNNVDQIIKGLSS